MFFGGFWNIKLSSIYITKTNKSFSSIVNALSYFDSYISGSYNFGWKSPQKNQISDHEISLLICLLNKNDKNDEMEKIEPDGYMQSTFNCFIRNKTDIIINCYNLSKSSTNGQIRDLVMNKLENKKDFKAVRADDDPTNLFQVKLLDLFSNLKSITLITGDQHEINKCGYSNRSLSMTLLLSMIKHKALEQILILSYDPLGKGNSWQSYLWQTSSSKLIPTYQESGYILQFKYSLGFDNAYNGFIINRMT